MSIYSLQVKISNDIVTQYNQKSASMYLCFALGNQLDSSPGSPVLFNVIVATVGPGQFTDIMTFSWQEKYQIAGCKTLGGGSNNESVVTASTTQPQDINYGQSYTVKWSGTSSVRNDPDAPESGFTFIIPSQETPTSALVYAQVLTPKQAEGMDPYYISPNGPLGAGSESLYPAHQARVWFQESAKAGMIKSTWPRNGVMAYTGTPLTVKYGEGIYALKCSYTSSGWSNPSTA